MSPPLSRHSTYKGNLGGDCLVHRSGNHLSLSVISVSRGKGSELRSQIWSNTMDKEELSLLRHLQAVRETREAADMRWEAPRTETEQSVWELKGYRFELAY